MLPVGLNYIVKQNEAKQTTKKKKAKNLLESASLSLGFTFLAGGILSLGALDSVGTVSLARPGIVLHGSQQHYNRVY